MLAAIDGLLVVLEPPALLWANPSYRERLGDEVDPRLLAAADGDEIELDGRVLRVKRRPVAGHVLLVLDDVTDGVRTAEVARSLGRVFRDATDPILLLDLDGVVTDANPATGRLYGWRRDEVVGQPLLRLVPPERHPRVRRQLARLLEGERIRSGEGVRLRSDGTEVPVAVTMSRLTDEADRPVGFCSIEKSLLDIAEYERAVAELERKNAELERFTYTVSHDLKSPLITIKGFLGRLSRDARAGDLTKLEHRVSRIGRAADRMEELLDDLLELSRVGRLANPAEPVALGQVVDEVLELLHEPLRAAEVDVRRAGPFPTVQGDRVRIREVLQNLVHNAVRYRGPQEPYVEIGARIDGDEVRCWVRDNGVGVDPRYHDKVFGLFEQLAPEGEGTGIGLALVKRIVEVHGGRVGVDSAGTGHGSTFWFTLPVEAP